MDVLRQLTRKFRAQDLSDRSSSTAADVRKMKEESHDSGAGSDDEVLQILPQPKNFRSINTSEDEQSSDEAYDNHEIISSADNHEQIFTSIDRSSASMDGSVFPVTCDCLADNYPTVRHGRHSAASSDFERCSLDFEASSLSDLEVHSSEEELATINRDEKRKRSQLSDDSSIFSDNDSEICELFGGQSKFSFDGVSLRLAEPFGAASLALENIPPPGRGGVSPRKRHRRERWTGTQRPSLDFYKMQKTCIVRRHSALTRPRPSRFWVINGSQRQTKTTFDPSPFSFRSLEFN